MKAKTGGKSFDSLAASQIDSKKVPLMNNCWSLQERMFAAALHVTAAVLWPDFTAAG